MASRLHLHADIYGTFCDLLKDSYNIRAIAAANAAINPPAARSGAAPPVAAAAGELVAAEVDDGDEGDEAAPVALAITWLVFVVLFALGNCRVFGTVIVLVPLKWVELW